MSTIKIEWGYLRNEVTFYSATLFPEVTANVGSTLEVAVRSPLSGPIQDLYARLTSTSGAAYAGIGSFEQNANNYVGPGVPLLVKVQRGDYIRAIETTALPSPNPGGGLPSITLPGDEGKALQVTGGAPAWVTPSGGGSGLPAGGANGQFLKIVSGAASWSNFPALFSGDYADLTGKPALFSGDYAALTGKPAFGTAALRDTGAATGNVPVLDGSGKLLASLVPSLDAAIIGSGTIDVARIPVLPSQIQVVSSGDLTALTGSQQNSIGQGTIVTTADGNRYVYSGSGSKTVSGSYILLADVTPDWTTVANKPAFSPVATSGAYVDLTGKPTLFSGAYSDLTGKPTLFSGAYSDLTGKPTLGTAAAAATTDFASAAHTHTFASLTGKPTTLAGYGITDAFNGAYASLSGKPTLGTAAALDVGTAAGNVVRLDPTTGKLPAIDGSLLTNLPSSGATVGVYEPRSIKNGYYKGTHFDWSHPNITTTLQDATTSPDEIWYFPSGTGAFASFSSSGVGNSIGTVNLTTGSTATGAVSACHASSRPTAAGNLKGFAASRVYLPVLSNSTDRFLTQFGICSSADVNAINFDTITTGSTYFSYSHDVNGGRWQCKSNRNGSITTVDSGVTVAATTWYDLRIEYDPSVPNAKFYINGTVVGTITTNLVLDLYAVTPCVLMAKTAGTTSLATNVDYLEHGYGYAGLTLSGLANVVPAGGTTGQVLAKQSGADGDTAWIAAPSGASTALPTPYVRYGDSASGDTTGTGWTATTPANFAGGVTGVVSQRDAFLYRLTANGASQTVEMNDYIPCAPGQVWTMDHTLYGSGAAGTFTPRIQQYDSTKAYNGPLDGTVYTNGTGQKQNSSQFVIPAGTYFFRPAFTASASVTNGSFLYFGSVRLSLGRVPDTGNVGQVLTKSAAGYSFADVTGITGLLRSMPIYHKGTDFDFTGTFSANLTDQQAANSPDKLSYAFSGTSAQCNVTASFQVGTAGVARLQTGGTNTGYGVIYFPDYRQPNGAAGQTQSFAARLAVEAAADGSNNYALYFGLGFYSEVAAFHNTTSDYAIFYYNIDDTGSAIYCKTKGSGGVTVVSSATGLSANSYRDYRIDVSLTDVKFYVDNVLVQTVTTAANIPRLAVAGLTGFVEIKKTLGSGTRNVYIDYMEHYWPRY